MKKLLIILVLLLFIVLIGNAQSDCQPRQFKGQIEDARDMKKDAYVKLGMGIFGHIIGTQELIGGPLSDPNVRSGFILYNSIGLTFDVLSVVQLIRANKKRNKYQNLL